MVSNKAKSDESANGSEYTILRITLAAIVGS